MYALIDAFERDMRDIFERYVLEDMSAIEALGPNYENALSKQRRADDAYASSALSIVEFLDFQEVYDLLNRHRSQLPGYLSNEILELSKNTGRLVSIRNRVMHGRPLAAGDPEALASMLNLFVAKQWRVLEETRSTLLNDPLWEPSDGPNPSDFGYAIHNLPLSDYDDTGLIGRESEVSKLTRMCTEGRENVITITGEGGIGKTAVALDVAYRLVDDRDTPFDVVLWCSLKTERLTAEGVKEIAEAISTLTGAVSSLASALDSPNISSFREMAELLSGIKTLIIIDNLETVNSTTFMDMYEAMPPEVKFLLTSRIGIGEVERRYPLAALAEQDAIRLLIYFANNRNVTPLRRLTNETRVEIVSRLRKSPLAIRWFVLAVEAGREPLTLIRNQNELLEFCVRSVYESLGREARKTLQALFALNRPVTTDELVVLTGASVDEVSRSIKELTRGALVTVSAQRDISGIFTIEISESASQFMKYSATTDDAYVTEMLHRDETFRTDEERRAIEAAGRSLAPIVIRTRDSSDAAVAQLLRRALLASQREDYSAARELLDSARSLNAEFWEVDRVEAFIRAAQGEHSTATNLYLRAYKAAPEDARAIVAHFFAGHLARNVKDVDAALRYAVEAYKTLPTDETALALGNMLVWMHRFDEGVRLIEPTLDSVKSRTRLIAATSLIEAHRRYGEYIRDQERSPLKAYREAWKGFEVAIPFLREGTIDHRLVSAAADSVGEALTCVSLAERNGVEIPSDLAEHAEAIAPFVSRLLPTHRGDYFYQSLVKACGNPTGALLFGDVKEKASTWARPSDDGKLSLQYAGHIHSIVSSTYGFIALPEFPENVFFHKSDCLPGTNFSDLQTGDRVRFLIEQHNGKLRAIQVCIDSYDAT